MRRIDILLSYLDSLPHRARRGHWPAWYLLGAGERWCVNCSRGGGGGRQRMLRPVPALHW